MLRCIELGLSKDIMQYLTPGDVFDMITEKANDAERYPLKATQDDINRFFG